MPRRGNMIFTNLSPYLCHGFTGQATSALDAASELMVNDAIDRILQGGKLTSLIVAHRLSTIARAERIVVLDGIYISYILRFFS